jgi:hypothetical protein
LVEQNETELSVLKEILKWIKFSGMKGVREQLESALDTNQKKVVFQLSDGSKGIVEIGEIAKVAGTATISRYWKAWSKMGFGEYVAVRGGDRFKRSFDLEELGIEVPAFEDEAATEKVSESKEKSDQTNPQV